LLNSNPILGGAIHFPGRIALRLFSGLLNFDSELLMTLYSKFPDDELIILLKKDDRNAYAEIFNRYKAPLYIFAYKKIGDREEAKDLVHELFVNTWEKRAQANMPGGLAPYLFGMLKNRIFDLFKHKKVTERYLDTFQYYLNTDNNNTDYLVRHNELNGLIEREIAALPEKMRRVFELSRKTNLSRKEIAEELNISEQTVKSHMFHALKTLKTRFGGLVVFITLFHP